MYYLLQLRKLPEVNVELAQREWCDPENDPDTKVTQALFVKSWT